MQIAFSQSTADVEVFDFLEVSIEVGNPSAENPFTYVALRGEFQREGGDPVAVSGFCDSLDGSLYRIRFMPMAAGAYSYSVTIKQGDEEETYFGAFTAKAGARPGLVQVDPEHPWHFIWSGTGEHYFWNGTTAYWLAGWDEETMLASIDRLHRLKVNRLRVSLHARIESGDAWDEKVYNTDKFTYNLNPWIAERPDNVDDPGYDLMRFNVPYWRHFEKLLHHAREKDMIVEVLFFTDGARPGDYPYDRSRIDDPREEVYYAYGVARFGAFSNITWDVTNEYHLYRPEEWVNRLGTYLDAIDPYNHLISVHGGGEFPFRTEPWADFAIYQAWDEGGGNGFMLEQRRQQAATGRPMPQVNEEYGYEDHYPAGWGFGVVAPGRDADNRRRLAWGMYMAGGYQSTGERADTGTGWGPDTGGGWINGRGDDSMVMLHGYARIVDFFTAIPWWKLEPDNTLADNGAMALAEPGRQYVLYIPNGGSASLMVERGVYKAAAYDPITGVYTDLPDVGGPQWTCPTVPEGRDGVFLLQKA